MPISRAAGRNALRTRVCHEVAESSARRGSSSNNGAGLNRNRSRSACPRRRPASVRHGLTVHFCSLRNAPPPLPSSLPSFPPPPPRRAAWWVASDIRPERRNTLRFCFVRVNRRGFLDPLGPPKLVCHHDSDSHLARGDDAVFRTGRQDTGNGFHCYSGLVLQCPPRSIRACESRNSRICVKAASNFSPRTSALGTCNVEMSTLIGRTRTVTIVRRRALEL